METGLGHTEWVQWTLAGNVDDFYADLRWDGWQELASTLAPGQGFSAYAPPFTAEGRANGVSRKAIPLLEVYGVTREYARQVNGGG